MPALRGRGDALLGEHLLHDALVFYDRALTSSPDDPASLNNRGFVLHQPKRFDEALACYERALAIVPELVVRTGMKLSCRSCAAISSADGRNTSGDGDATIWQRSSVTSHGRSGSEMRRLLGELS